MAKRLKYGFSLVELITVLAILGTGLSVFYSVFFINWSSLEEQIRMVDLQMDADRIIETVAFDSKIAKGIVVDNTGKLATINFLSGNSVNYSFTPQGNFMREFNATTTVISNNIDFTNSSFVQDIDSLLVNLTLMDNVLGRRRIELEVSSRFFPRNSF